MEIPTNVTGCPCPPTPPPQISGPCRCAFIGLLLFLLGNISPVRLVGIRGIDAGEFPELLHDDRFPGVFVIDIGISQRWPAVVQVPTGQRAVRRVEGIHGIVDESLQAVTVDVHQL